MPSVVLPDREGITFTRCGRIAPGYLEGFYDAFWSNLVRWMALGSEFRPDEQVSLRLGATAVRLGEVLPADVALRFGTFGDAAPELTLIDPGGAARRVSLRRPPGRGGNRFRAEVETRVPGVHELVLSAPGFTPARLVRKFNVIDANTERLDTSADPVAMRRLSEGSGGAVLRPDRPRELLDLLDRQREARLVPPRPEYVWDSGVVLVVLLTWAGVEWIARRRGGLL